MQQVCAQRCVETAAAAATGQGRGILRTIGSKRVFWAGKDPDSPGNIHAREGAQRTRRYTPRHPVPPPPLLVRLQYGTLQIVYKTSGNTIKPTGHGSTGRNFIRCTARGPLPSW